MNISSPGGCSPNEESSLWSECKVHVTLPFIRRAVFLGFFVFAALVMSLAAVLYFRRNCNNSSFRADLLQYIALVTASELLYERYTFTRNITWMNEFQKYYVLASSQEDLLKTSYAYDNCSQLWSNYAAHQVAMLQQPQNFSLPEFFMPLNMNMGSCDTSCAVLMQKLFLLLLLFSAAWFVTGVVLVIVEKVLKRQCFLQKEVLDRVLPENISAKIVQAVNAGENIYSCTLKLARFHSLATVAFADLVDFTNISSKLPPATLVALLNVIFTQYDLLASHYGVMKIKTIGDCYMAVAGLNEGEEEQEQAMETMFLFSRDLILVTTGLVEHYRSLQTLPHPDSRGFTEVLPHSQSAGENVTLMLRRRLSSIACELHTRQFPDLALRVGIHSGPLVSGIVGVSALSFDIWGDTVNVASRMETTGAPNHIHCTAASKDLLNPTFPYLRCPMTFVKGKGPMETFLFVVGAECSDVLSHLAEPTQSVAACSLALDRSTNSPAPPPLADLPAVDRASVDLDRASVARVARDMSSSFTQATAYFGDHLSNFFAPMNPLAGSAGIALDSGYHRHQSMLAGMRGGLSRGGSGLSVFDLVQFGRLHAKSKDRSRLHPNAVDPSDIHRSVSETCSVRQVPRYEDVITSLNQPTSQEDVQLQQQQQPPESARVTLVRTNSKESFRARKFTPQNSDPGSEVTEVGSGGVVNKGSTTPTTTRSSHKSGYTTPTTRPSNEVNNGSSSHLTPKGSSQSSVSSPRTATPPAVTLAPETSTPATAAAVTPRRMISLVQAVTALLAAGGEGEGEELGGGMISPSSLSAAAAPTQLPLPHVPPSVEVAPAQETTGV